MGEYVGLLSGRVGGRSDYSCAAVTGPRALVC